MLRSVVYPMYARLSRNDGREPPIDPVYLEWRKFYFDRVSRYASLELQKFEGDTYMDWYQGGGYGYNPVAERVWLMRNTQLADFRGTCVDVGSGDGFWSVILSEWYHVIGVDPSPAGIDLANAIKRKIPAKIAGRIDYVLGDALDLNEVYDVNFCRAPSFLNYPPSQEWSEAMLDSDRRNYRALLEADDPLTAEQKLKEYPKFNAGLPHEYAHRFRWCLERMLAMTRKLFVFIMSTDPRFYGQYYGDTYAHDPEVLRKVFNEYGQATVKVVGSYIVAEIVK